MRVILKTANPLNRDYFRSGDTLFGAIEWDSKLTSTVSRITTSLEGKLKIAVRPIECCQEAGFLKKQKILFKAERSLQFSENGTVERCGFENTPGVTKLEFDLDFPLLIPDGQGTSEKLHLAPLPPSCSLISDILKVSVVYILRVVIERRGFLRQTRSIQRKVEFRPFSTSEPYSHNHERTTRLLSYLSEAALGVNGRSANTLCDLPLYTPSLALAVDLPFCQRIFPGTHINLDISFMVPAEMSPTFSLIRIVSLNIRLKVLTHGIAGSQARTHTDYVDCVTMKGLMLLKPEEGSNRISFPPELWRSHVYPTLIASFDLSSARRSYELEVIVNFALSSAQNVHRVGVHTSVVVEDGADNATDAPPNYDS